MEASSEPDDRGVRLRLVSTSMTDKANDPLATATIENLDSGETKTFGICDNVAEQCILTEVLPDHVILFNFSVSCHEVLKGSEAVVRERPKSEPGAEEAISVKREELVEAGITTLADIVQTLETQGWQDEGGRPVGLAIQRADEGSLASKLGLQQGDVVQLVGRFPVGFEKEVPERLSSRDLTESLSLRVLRNGQPRAVTIRFSGGERPPARPSIVRPARPPAEQIAVAPPRLALPARVARPAGADSPFDSEALEAAVRAAIGKPEGVLTPEDLAREGFTELRVSDRDIRDIEGIQACTSLKKVWLDGTSIEDVSPLTALTGLEYLNISGNPITSVEPLSSLTKLKELSMGWQKVSDFAPLAKLTGLEVLVAGGNPVTDVAPLATLTGLKRLWLDNCRIEDIAPLTGLAALEELRLENNRLRSLPDVSPWTNLQSLRLDGNMLTDISPLASLASLRSVYLADNHIVDLEPLAKLPALEWVYAARNSVRDYGTLAGLANLRRLDASDNDIDSVDFLAELPHLEEVILHHCVIEDIAPLLESAGLGEGDTLDLRSNPLSEEALMEHIPALLAKGVRVLYTPTNIAPPSGPHGLRECQSARGRRRRVVGRRLQRHPVRRGCHG